MSDLLDATCEEVAGVSDVDSQESIRVDDSLTSDELDEEMAGHMADDAEVEDNSIHHASLQGHDIDDVEVDELITEDEPLRGVGEDSMGGIEGEDNVSPHELGSVDDEYDDTGEQDLMEDDIEGGVEES